MNVNIEQIKNRALVKYPFFGTVISNVGYKEDNSLPTLATDGKIVYYNSEFLSSLDSDQQLFAYAHEICHIAYDHIYRSEEKIPRLWNIATDAVINAQLIEKDGLKAIQGVVVIPGAEKYDAEELYEKLLEEDKKKQEQGECNNSKEDGSQSNDSLGDGFENQTTNQGDEKNSSLGEDGDEQKNTQGHDSHELWEEAIEKRNNSSLNNDTDSGNLGGQNGDELFSSVQEISKMGEKTAFDENRRQREENLRKLRRSLLDEAKTAVTMPSSNTIKVGSIGTSKPLVDWRLILREAINYDTDYSYINPYVEDGIIRASSIDIPYSETEIVLDTSGSISIDLLRNFLRECKNIFQNSRIKVGCFDVKFYGFNEIRSNDDISNMPFYGGGGTNFDVAVEAFTNRAENKIIFTDGMARMPSKKVNAIWIVFGGARIKPEGGRVIYISDEDLKKLNNVEDTSLKGKRR